MDNNNRTYYSHEAELRSGRKNTALLVLALGVGAASTLLLAPNSGKKTREDVMRGLEEGVNKGQEMLNPTVKRLEKELAELRKNVEEKIEEWRKA